MELLLKLILILHIASGFLSLLTGLAALVVKKGGRAHRLSGKVFFYGMCGVALSGLVLGWAKANYFLLMIALFAFFMNYSGYRSTRNKSLKPNFWDWVVLATGLINSFFMLYSFNIVLMVFGGIGAALALGDVRIFILTSRGREIGRLQWLFRHIGMMVGAYIATVTAFVVVNVHNMRPAWLPWLLPTVLLVPVIVYYNIKYRRNIKKPGMMALLIMGAVVSADAQPYTGAHTRHRFAQLNVGADIRVWPGTNTRAYITDATGGLKPFTLDNHTEGRLIIGGTHFWGHADFYIAFPIASLGSGIYTGAETGGKYYPWAIRRGGVRPYVGAAWTPVVYRQGEGPHKLIHSFPVLAGLTYNHKNHLVEWSAGYSYDNRLRYYINRTTQVPVQLPGFFTGITYKYMLETTLSAERNWQSGYTRRLTDTLARLGRLNGITLAVGASTGIFLKASPHNKAVAPSLGDHKVSNVFPDWAVGYYWHRPDIQFNISLRNIKSRIEAYGAEQTLRRTSVAIEAYKFLGDYHGFVPFAGPVISHEQLSIDGPGTDNANSPGIKAGLVAGWDIRPDRLQAWYLRTNLRWFPGMDVAMPSGKSVGADMLEVNFIQLVVFPGRLF